MRKEGYERGHMSSVCHEGLGEGSIEVSADG